MAGQSRVDQGRRSRLSDSTSGSTRCVGTATRCSCWALGRARRASSTPGRGREGRSREEGSARAREGRSNRWNVYLKGRMTPIEIRARSEQEANGEAGHNGEQVPHDRGACCQPGRGRSERSRAEDYNSFDAALRGAKAQGWTHVLLPAAADSYILLRAVRFLWSISVDVCGAVQELWGDGTWSHLDPLLRDAGPVPNGDVSIHEVIARAREGDTKFERCVQHVKQASPDAIRGPRATPLSAASPSRTRARTSTGTARTTATTGTTTPTSARLSSSSARGQAKPQARLVRGRQEGRGRAGRDARRGQRGGREAPAQPAHGSRRGRLHTHRLAWRRGRHRARSGVLTQGVDISSPKKLHAAMRALSPSRGRSASGPSARASKARWSGSLWNSRSGQVDHAAIDVATFVGTAATLRNAGAVSVIAAHCHPAARREPEPRRQGSDQATEEGDGRDRHALRRSLLDRQGFWARA